MEIRYTELSDHSVQFAIKSATKITLQTKDVELNNFCCSFQSFHNSY